MSLATPPAQLVEDGRQHLGRFSGPLRANLLDARYKDLARPLRWWRLKEWQALQIATPRFFVNLALFDAKLMALRQIKIFDRERSQKLLPERKLPPGALRLADQLFDSTNRFADRQGALTFRNRLAEGRIEVDFDVAASSDHPRLFGHLEVRTDRGASQVVSLPFEGEIGMYSHKGMFPIEGELRIGDETHPIRALALLDDHKGYYPYVMRWDWVTAATFDASGRAIGLNLTRNQCRDPERYNENCAWIGDRIGRLPAIEVRREGPPNERWILRDREGKVDVVFEPTVPGDVRVNAIIVESRYKGPCGRLRGRVAPEGLEPLELDTFGMGEEFWLRC